MAVVSALASTPASAASSALPASAAGTLSAGRSVSSRTSDVAVATPGVLRAGAGIVLTERASVADVSVLMVLTAFFTPIGADDDCAIAGAKRAAADKARVAFHFSADVSSESGACHLAAGIKAKRNLVVLLLGGGQELGRRVGLETDGALFLTPLVAAAMEQASVERRDEEETGVIGVVENVS